MIHILWNHLLDAFIILHPRDELVTFNNLLKLFQILQRRQSHFLNWQLLFLIILAWNTQNTRSAIWFIICSDSHDENHNATVYWVIPERVFSAPRFMWCLEWCSCHVSLSLWKTLCPLVYLHISNWTGQINTPKNAEKQYFTDRRTRYIFIGISGFEGPG